MKNRGTRLPLKNTAGWLAVVMTVAFLILAGCNAIDLNPNTDPDLEPTPRLTGEILVELQAGYTATHLDSLLDTLEVTRSGGFEGDVFRISVPQGEEAHWVGVLRAKAIIRAADLNRFGYAYGLTERDSLPRLRGDSLYVEVAYGGCAPGHAFTLGSSRTGASSFDVWLYKENEEDCRAAFVEVRAFKVPDAVLNADTVRLVKPLDARIMLAPAPKTPVYDFGLGYELIRNDSLPRLRGDSLEVKLAHQCGGGFIVEQHEVADSEYEIWLNKFITTTCAMPVVEERAFKLAEEIVNARSVVLVTSARERIVLKD